MQGLLVEATGFSAADGLLVQSYDVACLKSLIQTEIYDKVVLNSKNLIRGEKR